MELTGSLQLEGFEMGRGFLEYPITYIEYIPSFFKNFEFECFHGNRNSLSIRPYFLGTQTRLIAGEREVFVFLPRPRFFAFH